MNYLDEILNKYKNYSQVEKRIAIFNYVRDMHYIINGKQDPHSLYLNQKGDCAAKARLLSLLFRKLGYKTRFLFIRYKLRNFPKEVKYIPNQIDYHHALQIKIGNKWITLDATYDSGLKGKFFRVNNWDGIHSTPLAEKPLAIRIRGVKDIKFDNQFKLFIKDLNFACKRYSKETAKYTSNFNKSIVKIRKNKPSQSL